MTPLTDVNVVEIGECVGLGLAYGARLLADLGADVVIAEPPAGGALRRVPSDATHPVASEMFELLSAGKRSVTYRGSDDLRAALVHADIVLDGSATLEAAGISGADLHGLCPSAAIVRASAWGRTGPYRDLPATGLVLQAAAGWVTSRRDPAIPLVQVGGRLQEWLAGAYIATAALTALRHARGTGEFVEADLSVHECMHSAVAQVRLAMENYAELGLANSAPSITPFGVRPCADGWVGINLLTGQQWIDMCLVTGLEDYCDLEQELQRGDVCGADFTARLGAWLKDRTVDEVVDIGQSLRIPVVPVATGSSVTSLPQFVARGFFTTDQSAAVSVRPGPVWRYSDTPARGADPAPKLGLLSGNHLLPRRTRRMSASRPSPFDGLRVVELGTFWSAPYVTAYLGAFGADVVKIESVQRPDGYRYHGTSPGLGANWFERSLMWQSTNLNKRDITLNLGSPQGGALARELIRNADVFVENYAVRVAEQFGLGYESLRKLNPSLIVLRMPGYGLEGPWRDFVGWGNAFEQLAGFASVTGYPDGRPQTPGGYFDPIVGMHAAAGLIAALDHRERTGRGQLIEVAQAEVGAAMGIEQVLVWQRTGTVPTRDGNRTLEFAPQGVYRCADDRFLAMSIRTDADWSALVQVVGTRPEVPANRLSTTAGRRRCHDELDAWLQGWAGEHPVDELVTALRAEGIPACAVLTPADFYDNEQLRARGTYESVTHPISGDRLLPGSPIRLRAGEHTVGKHRTPAPTLGQHTREVLSELGVDDATYAELEHLAVVGRTPVGLSP